MNSFKTRVDYPVQAFKPFKPDDRASQDNLYHFVQDYITIRPIILLSARVNIYPRSEARKFTYLDIV